MGHVVETLTKTITSLNSPIVPAQQELEAIVRELFAKNPNQEIVEDMQLHQSKVRRERREGRSE